MQSFDEQYGRDEYGGSSNNGSSTSASASNWGSSSVPSTPGAGVYTPGYVGGFSHANANPNSSNADNVNTPANAPNDATSPKLPTIGIGKMSLGSRYDTPRRSVVGLPGDDGDERGDGSEEGEGMVVERDPRDIRDFGRKGLMVDTVGVKEEEQRGMGRVVVVDSDSGDEERERGVCGMDVDADA